jgi:hypothetical protein
MRELALARGLALITAAMTTACGTLSTSVLRHQTGETLGPGRIKIAARLESARMTPLVPTGSATATTEQSTDVFQAASFGVQGEIGVTPKWDFQLATNYSKGGGGWRLGLKYGIRKFGKFDLAAMVGYGSYFGAGDVTFLTPTTPETMNQTLAAQVFDLGFPISFRLGPAVALYSGASFFRAGVRGSAGNDAVSVVTTDLGVNLGVRLTFGRIEGDLELMMLRVSDPFVDGTRMVPFFGISCGVLF